ncbi:hypothetical protein CK203_018234 [Vitis vinifera]|uniref:Uncharacterized protein n=1 Tax=Vitis vinifera TaxID=29760 RepID=A0A438JP58_VITVI|nr:hypothetical protein CK203_090362 [Vitis vinifera]RVX10722.1 hypothetical protein CK203_018234 [Vitis vinifera]
MQTSNFLPGQEAREENSAEGNVALQTMTPRIRKYMWWLQIAILNQI